MVEDVMRTGLVVALLGVGLVGAFGAAGRVSPDVRVTAYAGFWAGVFLLGVLTISVDSFQPPLAAALAVIRSPFAAMLGGVAGILVIGLFGALRGSRAVGVVFIAQTVIAGSGLILYFRVDENVRVRIALLTLGAAVGVCLTFLVPRRFIDDYERLRSDRAAARRTVRAGHRRNPIDRQAALRALMTVRTYRRERRRRRFDAVRRRFRWPGSPS